MQDVEELKKFAKAAFDVESILTTANHLKYTRAIQNTLSEWMINPPEDFVRLVSAEFLAGKHFKNAVKDQFTLITKRAFQQLVGDKINERLKGAMTPEPVLVPEVAAPADAAGATSEGFVPSAIELEAFQVIRAILRPVVKPGRISIRDAASYCAILFATTTASRFADYGLTTRASWSSGCSTRARKKNASPSRASTTSLISLIASMPA